MPTPSGVCASPTIRNPTSDPLADPVATTAGSGCVSEAVAGSRIVAPRGTRLTRRTLSRQRDTLAVFARLDDDLAAGLCPLERGGDRFDQAGQSGSAD